MTDTELFGLSTGHLRRWHSHWVHPGILDDLNHLEENAREAGFQLGVASAFRSFERQLQIWNDKATGVRPVLDEQERPLNLADFDDDQIVQKIMRWSALPGASRHHWGTDFDVFDAGAVAAGHSLALTISETHDDGPFSAFYQWLEGYLSRHSQRFFRPYATDRGGVSVEPWHLSHTRIAREIQPQLTLMRLKALLSTSDLRLKSTVLNSLETLYDQFIWVPLSAYPQSKAPE